MSGSVNKVILVGNLGRDPEIRTLNSGDRVANFSLATSESWRDRTSGERYGHTGVPDLVQFFRPLTSQIVITHFGSWFYKDIAGSIRKIEALGNGVRVVAAYDGLTMEV